MTLQELLTKRVETPSIECWDDESTASALRALAVRLHSTGVSLRETAAALESIGIFRSHQAVFHWVHRVGEEAPDPPTAQPSRVAVDETAIKIGREQFWLYAAIDVDSKLLLGVRVSRWQGTRPASAFLSELKERHDLSETEFLVDGMGYLTTLAQTDLGGHLDYVMRNLIEKWSQTLTMRIARFHETWMGGRASAARWLAAFAFYYNYQRPNQALDNRTPVEEADLPSDADTLNEDDENAEKGGTIVLEKVTCGDETCKCLREGEKHGPYRKRYYRKPDGTFTLEYLGKP